MNFFTKNKFLTKYLRMGQRGYSLVELALALAIVGIIMGGLVVPIGNQLRSDVYQEANIQVGEIVDAIIGYAASNRSPGFRLLHSYQQTSGSGLSVGNGFRLQTIPYGRPYLPCPDTNGDGHEDRAVLIRPSIENEGQLLDPTAIVTFNDTLNSTLISLLDYEVGTQDNLPLGDCTNYRGAVPYATLGIKPGDPWGRAHTYIVNPMFATGAFGFDQHTRALSYLTIAEGRFHHNSLVNATYPYYPVMHGWGTFGQVTTLPCRVGSVYATNMDRFGCSQSYMEQVLPSSFDVGSANSSEAAYYGSTSIDYLDTTVLDGNGPNFATQSGVRAVTDGLPFVVISHGMNQAGSAPALIYTGNTTYYECTDNPTNREELTNAMFSICNSGPPPLIGSQSSRPSNDLTFLSNHAVVYSWIYAARRGPTTRDDAYSGEIYFAPNFADDETFDDVVTWLTRRELSARLRKLGIFPLAEEQLFDGLYSSLATYVNQ